jgi:hypothetical protein
VRRSGRTVEVADRRDDLELLRDRLDPRPRLLPPMPGEQQSPAIDDAGSLAAGDLPLAAARIGRVDQAATVVDHENRSVRRALARCRNASRLQSRVSAPSPSVSHSTSACGQRLDRLREAFQPVDAADHVLKRRAGAAR